MFDALCIMAAGLLAAFSLDRHRYIAVAVFFEFSAHQVLYQWGIVETDFLKQWLIYFAYAVVQLFVIAYLYLLKSHFIIAGLILLNMIYNLIATYFGYMAWEQGENLQTFNSIYGTYTGFIGTIMILELLYLGCLCRYANVYARKYGNDNLDFVDRLFRVRGWSGHGDMA